jgi:hypothetical protein
LQPIAAMPCDCTRRRRAPAPHQGFERGDELATIGPSNGDVVFSIPFEIVERLADEISSIEAAATLGSANVLAGPDREETLIGTVSKAFFNGLRPRLALGRGFRVEDLAPVAAPVVVLSYRYWQERFGGDRGVLGSHIELARDPSQRYQGRTLIAQVEPKEPSERFESSCFLRAACWLRWSQRRT